MSPILTSLILLPLVAAVVTYFSGRHAVHGATAARWVAQARERLGTLTRKRFLTATPMHEKSYAEALALVRSQLAVNLANLLKQVITDDRPPG